MAKQKTVADYASMETAGTYKKQRSDAHTRVDAAQLAACLADLKEHGYTIIPDLISPQRVAEIRAVVDPLLDKTGRNFFEGEATQRVYSVISKTFVCNDLIEHPLILALLDEVLHPDYLLSQMQLINILSGEKAQPLHYDDSFYEIDRPRPPMGAATIWALDDFTEDNGATVLIPGSHRWPQRTPESDTDRQISATMSAGSVLFFLGTLWHGGGENHSQGARLAATAQYCEGFCRPQENYSLSVPPDTAARCSETLQRLLGYSVFGPFMGMVDGQHPKRLLEPYLPDEEA